MLFVFIVNNIFLFRLKPQTPVNSYCPINIKMYILYRHVYVTDKETETYFMMLKDNVPSFLEQTN